MYKRLIDGQLDLADFEQVFSDFGKTASSTYKGVGGWEVGWGGGSGGGQREPVEQAGPATNQTSSPMGPRPYQKSTRR